MSIRVALHHETTYRYDRLVSLGPQVIRLRPVPHCRTPIVGYSLRVTPEEHFLNWQQDPQGNFLARVVVRTPTRQLQVVVDVVADLSIINPFDFFLEESAEEWPFAYEPALAEELEPYLATEPAGPLLEAWLRGVAREPARTVDFLVALNQRLQADIEYVVRLEPGVQSPEETLGLARGSCRDSAWLLVQILRRLGIAARFASGYLIQLVADVPSLDGPSGPSADFTDLHAWAEAYLPGGGWIGLDPTSGLLAGEGHLPLACSPKPQSAAPISGTLDECEVELIHSMSVARIVETPRVTLPYSEDEWQAVCSLGEEVDRRLAAGDVRLTMGGEPTLVSIDDFDGAEWNTAAVGPTKRVRAADLVHRLRDRFAPNGLLHYGQGKWYPGEPLPRWSFSLYWRADEKPLWHDIRRIAQEARDFAPTPAQAERFAQGIARRLAVDPGCVLPCYEDPVAHLAREASLPANVDVLDSKLDDPEERARLVRVFSRGLGRPVAFALPVQAWNARDGRRWRSERWRLRREHLFLQPGDSPVGFRLPLGSLPFVPALDYPHVLPLDPSVAHPPLAASDPQRQRRREGTRDAPAPEATTGDGSGSGGGIGGSVRTALVVEPRDGRLCVFLPPVESADEYVDLVAAVEDVASELDVPVHVEGYPPPPDPRLRTIAVTPDPGVIEVNVHPAASWQELVDTTTAVYEEARLARLCTEKFMLDGRHTGTGGGNHIVLGGATPADSPFLRRPDLLRSLLAYWINHPSLSYLFSGLFIGPTSQAPRIDEARQDSVHELEVAFAQIPEPGQGTCPPWLVDRIFRDLLVDVSGNTHRAEFCIDKLYSPDSATGRLGLVELRAFEMPPHARMSLVQQLLLRALVAHFWEEPCRQAPLRWGNALHDRFLLPHHVWADFCEVIEETRAAGFALEADWFRPHFEFRFPRYGAVRCGEVEIELRQALEPWHVLGEEGAVGGTARFVDASLERLQVRVRGLSARYAVGCNGFALPLLPTGTGGEQVAGVRFRAWQPPRCLHPTIPVHAPLTFDLVDRWSGRAVAGCRYHVSHPGGLSYDEFPLNANEAEGRRLARFFPFGHTPGPLSLREPPPNRDFPNTLDLRTCGP
jgi:uncharacterized protein (DUF2126 family)